MRCGSRRAGRSVRARAGLGLAISALLAGCSLAPAYDVPPSQAAPAYKEGGPWQSAAATIVPPGRWWEAFGDPVLSGLEDRIERDNPSLAAAVARYDEARGALGVARAARVPSVDLAVAAERARVSAERPLGATGAQTYNDIRVGPSLSYELDLFGRVRNSVRASTADAQASAADVAGVRLGLQASLADDYFQMRGLDARIVLLRQTVAAFQRASDLTDTRHAGGIASGIDVSRSASLLQSARAELSAVSGDRAAFEHAIAVLIGQSPSSFAIPVVDGQAPPPAIPVGIPSTLLERRPDIAAAERRIAAANARIGVARAALYPALTLGVGGGFETAGSAVIGASTGFWALGPLTAALSIFDGGARRSRVRISRGQYDEAAANYRSTVLTAFREVEDDLARTRAATEQEGEQQAATRAAERTRDLALIRYRDGASDYLDVVTAQTAALDAERALLQIRTNRLRLAVDTARAIGGGA
ncbi:efflux transporter outer membrane subunit [Sphingomonas sp. CROZ-RG-20F-R02-07]|uniref:efflux transporter outer membrane subunit n=1 Tax=Sphingomonas sp. CROZ-RG-20F-R02-07 TaxID=2914832 RepID=UPI001F5675FB|nr:efflux transporter outer membrane subunit [Sphingomonas sp. CROZ-RG-20F-R02-07]